MTDDEDQLSSSDLTRSVETEEELISLRSPSVNSKFQSDLSSLKCVCARESVSSRTRLTLPGVEERQLNRNQSHKFTSVQTHFQYIRRKGGQGGGDHVRIMKLTPLRAGSPAHTQGSCSGSTAGCWWCGCSSGPGRARRARRTGPSSAQNHPGSGGVAAARLPSFLSDEKLSLPACNAGGTGGRRSGTSIVQFLERRVPAHRACAFGPAVMGEHYWNICIINVSHL